MLSATVLITITPSIENISITLTNAETGKTYTGVTDITGSASIRIKETGIYSIQYDTSIRLNSPSTISIEEFGTVYYINAE